jgi:hypothetical protein
MRGVVFCAFLFSEKTRAEKGELLARLSEAEVKLQSLWGQVAAFQDLERCDCKESSQSLAGVGHACVLCCS